MSAHKPEWWATTHESGAVVIGGRPVWAVVSQGPEDDGPWEWSVMAGPETIRKVLLAGESPTAKDAIDAAEGAIRGMAQCPACGREVKQ